MTVTVTVSKKLQKLKTNALAVGFINVNRKYKT